MRRIPAAGLVLLGALAAVWAVRDPPRGGPERVDAVESSLRRPLLLIGIDGATFDVMDSLLDAGRLPHLAGLIDSGSSGRLATIEPTVSPAIWTTIATGRLPEEHGILGFDGVPGHTMTTLPTSQMRKVPAFWNILSEHGRSVGVIGWWATWPAEKVNGYVVSDRTTYTRMEASTGDEATRPYEVYPEELAEEIAAKVRLPNEIDRGTLSRLLGEDTDELYRRAIDSAYDHGELLTELKYVVQSDRSTTDIALDLLRERPTDVTAVGLYAVDAMSHLSWHFHEPESFPSEASTAADRDRFGGLLEGTYELVDGLVGELVGAAGPQTTVIVFSDHGFGPTGRLPWSGGHGRITPGAAIAPDGILIASGSSVRRGVAVRGAHVLDLAPTLLYLQGLPPSFEMRGTPRLDLLDPAFVAEGPTGRVASYDFIEGSAPKDLLSDPALDREMLEKLRALGYTD